MSNKFKYIPSFDGIRGIAVLSVLLIHLTYGKFQGGFLGVDLFFVLSGYLITSILQKEYVQKGEISFINFYARRGLRLIPPLLICIILYTVYLQFFPLESAENPVISILASLFYFSNLIFKSFLGPMVHLWSLSVEEHFYLFWPILLTAFIFKISIKKRIGVLGIFIILITLFRIWVYHYNRTDELSYGYFTIDSYTFTFCRIDAIMLGALTAIASRDFNFKFPVKNYTWSMYFLLGIFGLLLLFVDSHNPLWRYGGFIITNAVCLLLVIVAIKNPNNRLLTNRILKWLGQRSYGIYVYHYLVFMALENYRIPGDAMNLLWISALRLFISFIIAEISYQFIEKPILKYKTRFQDNSVKENIYLKRQEID